MLAFLPPTFSSCEYQNHIETLVARAFLSFYPPPKHVHKHRGEKSLSNLPEKFFGPISDDLVEAPKISSKLYSVACKAAG